MAELHLSLPSRRACLALLTLAALFVGCNAPEVGRDAEVTRFREEIAVRTAGLDLKPTAPLTMRRCEEIALANSLDLSVRRKLLSLEDEKVRLALSGYFPSADLNYTNQLRSNENAIKQNGMTFPAAGRHEQNLSINATVPILDFGVTYFAWKIALDEQAQQYLILKRTEQQLRRDVRIAYARHASELRQLAHAATNVKAAEEVLRVADAQQREGLSTSAETAVVRATLAQARVDESSTRQRVAETRLALMTLLSLPPAGPVLIDEELPALPPPPPEAELAQLEDHALRVRPELHSQDLQRHLSANQVRHEIAGFFPKFNAIGSFNLSNNVYLANPAYFLGGIQVAQSLLEAPTRIIRVRAAKVLVNVETERTLLLSLGVLYDVDLRAIQLHRGRDTIAALIVQEEAQREAFARILSLYKEGLENEAATARALAELSIQTMDLDKARTDYQVWWYEFEAAALPDEADPTAPPATEPPAATATRPSVATVPTSSPSPATVPAK